MKPLGTNNAAENELTTPKSTFGKLVSQCGLSTKSQYQKTNQPLKRCQFWIFTTLINTEIKCRYDMSFYR
ncbi:hypothetical protein CGJ21_21595 [Vibrio parahaemolyticus]|nr:hypothetical protein CGJ23_21830 [Vibrio parahaemolyticus]TOF45212.1 hypothetical protein CGJ21_21595 [Vibrio parahaemolyticus]